MLGRPHRPPAQGPAHPFPSLYLVSNNNSPKQLLVKIVYFMKMVELPILWSFPTYQVCDCFWSIMRRSMSITNSLHDTRLICCFIYTLSNRILSHFSRKVQFLLQHYYRMFPPNWWKIQKRSCFKYKMFCENCTINAITHLLFWKKNVSSMVLERRPNN